MTDFFKTAVSRAKRFEGFSAVPYKCPAGRWTVGYGLNLERGTFSPRVLQILGEALVRAVGRQTGVNHKWDGLILRTEEAESILCDDIKTHWKELRAARPYVRDLCLNVRLVLLDMAFNMGTEGLLGFKNMFAALERGDWSATRYEMMDSRWAAQVGDRADANLRLLDDLTGSELSLLQRVNRLEYRIGKDWI